MPKDIIDRVITSAPLNATAAKVMARGEHWKPEKSPPPDLLHFDAPPPMIQYQPDPAGTSVDLTGTKFGRFTVMGVYAHLIGKGKQRWVCKCTCGDYEVRSAGAIRMATTYLNDKNETGYRCWNCQQWASIQKNYTKKGARPLSEFANAKDRIIQLEARSPNVVIAEEIAKITGGSDEATYEQATKIVAEIMRAGFRIVRDKFQGVASEAVDTPGIETQ